MLSSAKITTRKSTLDTGRQECAITARGSAVVERQPPREGCWLGLSARKRSQTEQIEMRKNAAYNSSVRPCCANPYECASHHATETGEFVGL